MGDTRADDAFVEKKIEATHFMCLDSSDVGRTWTKLNITGSLWNSRARSQDRCHLVLNEYREFWDVIFSEKPGRLIEARSASKDAPTRILERMKIGLENRSWGIWPSNSLRFLILGGHRAR